VRAFIESLPQGFLWYPTVLVLLIIGARIILLTARRPKGRSVKPPALPTRFEDFENRINHRSSHESLERSCIGMILTAEGYSGYSVANCRDFVEKGASEELRRVITEHLEDGGRLAKNGNGLHGRLRRMAGGGRLRAGSRDHKPAGQPLPPRVETLVSYIEEQMEA
jgi:hypothetical protein